MSETRHFGGLLRAIAQADPADVAQVVTSAAAALGGWDVVVYLADFEQQILEPLGDRAVHAEVSHAEEIGTTIAGRAFLQRQATTAERPDGVRVWVPIIEGSDVTGVLGLTLPRADDDLVAGCADLGVLTGYLLATQARVTDLYGLHRRRKAMTLAASLQWDLLPPLTFASSRVVVAGMLEPAYEVGGDLFDYALNGNQLELAFMDSMGHGLRSALVAALAVGCYRHDRREGRQLDFAHRNLDAAIAGEHGGEAFVTGHIARLDLTSGELAWVNAGHPSPLLIRSGRVVGPLNGPPTLPWGVGPSRFEVNTTSLQPGDSVLFYTDGVVEARSAKGRDFGIDRLSDLVGRFASDEIATPLIVRHIVRAVLDHHGGTLSDDATVLMVQWPGDHS